MTAKVKNGSVGHWDESAINSFFIAKVFYSCMQRYSHCITGLGEKLNNAPGSQKVELLRNVLAVMSPMNCGGITNKSVSTKYGPSTCGSFIGLLTQWLDKVKWLNSLCGTVFEITNVVIRSKVSKFCVVVLAYMVVGIRLNFANGYNIALQGVASLVELHHGWIKHYGLISGVPSMFVIPNIILYAYVQQCLNRLDSTHNMLFQSDAVKYAFIEHLCGFNRIAMIYYQEVTTPLLTLVVELILNKFQRGTRDSFFLDGKLLFGEVCNFIVAYGSQLVHLTDKANMSTFKYKGMIPLCLLTTNVLTAYEFSINLIVRCWKLSYTVISSQATIFATCNFSHTYAFFHFKQWDPDPGIFLLTTNFYNLEDKVDLEGVGNDRIMDVDLVD
jgi:hypothetical protein